MRLYTRLYKENPKTQIPNPKSPNHLCKRSSGTGTWYFRRSYRLEPVATFALGGVHGVRIRGLRSPLGVYRLQRGRRLRRIVSKEIARFLPFLQREAAEVATFRDQLPDHGPYDFVRPPERHPANRQVVGDVGCQQQA